MAFVRTKIVNGREYRSLEERYREGGKVKSRYVRSLTNSAVSTGHYQGEVAAFDAMQQQFEKDEAERPAREAAEKAQRAAFEKEHGVKLPDDPMNVTPVDKASQTASEAPVDASSTTGGQGTSEGGK